MIASTSNGDWYAFTDYPPEYSLGVAIDLLSDVSIEVFRASNDPKVKRELPVSMKSDYEIVVSRMIRRMGPAVDFQNTMQNAISACFDGLADKVGWDDQANLETLADALVILSGVIPNGEELWRAAYIISSSRFSKLGHLEEDEEEGGMKNNMVLKSKIAAERMWSRIAQTKGN
ncbi:hypothetical protein SCUP515_08708 [Seiridium cupressi]